MLWAYFADLQFVLLVLAGGVDCVDLRAGDSETGMIRSRSSRPEIWW